MIKKETVLCIEKKRLPPSWTQPVNIISMNLDTYVDTCTMAGYDFIRRSVAETDTSKKQVIPYVLLQTRDFKQMATIPDQSEGIIRVSV